MNQTFLQKPASFMSQSLATMTRSVPLWQAGKM